MDARRCGALAVIVALAACSGAGHGDFAVPGNARGSASLRVKVTLPAPPVRTASAKRSPQFVSPSTNGIQVKDTPSGSTTPITSTTDISSGSAACGGTVGLPRTCTVAIPAPPGASTLAFSTYDQAPVSGSFSGAKQLGAATDSVTITAGQANTVSVVIGGIPASVALALTAPIIHGTAPSSQTLTVTALDADGNVIVTDGYVDAQGNPVTIYLTQSIKDTGGGAPVAGTTTATAPNGGTVTLGTTTLTQPSTSGVTVSYDGGAQLPGCGANPCDGTLSDSIQAAIGSAAPTASVTLTTLGPKMQEFADPVPGSSPLSIATGPDGNVWFTDPANRAVGKVTPSGTISVYGLDVAVPGFLPIGIASGPGGKMWVAGRNPNGIVSVDVATSAISLVHSTTYPARSLTTGPDGNPWFTERDNASTRSQVGTMPPSGSYVSELSLPIGAMSLPFTAVDGITSGPDGRVWFAEPGLDEIGAITTSTLAIAQYRLPTFGSTPGGIAIGPDGNVWFTETSPTIGGVGKITTSGQVTEYNTGPVRSAQPVGITAGPDGNLWFTEYLANNIGRINPSTGTITVYPITSPSAQPTGITTGADGNLWFTEYNTNKIGELTW